MWSDYIDSVTLDPELGCGDANGRDIWFEVEVGANQVLTVVETNYLIPTVLQVVEACGPEEPCLFTGDEFAQWYNTTGATATILVGVEAAYPSITAGPVEVEFNRDAIPEGDSCSTAFDVNETSLPYSDSIDLWQYGSAWPSSLCEPAEGSDVWYAVDVPPDEVVFFEELSSTDTTVYLATECPADDCVSSADEPEAINWYNTTSSTVTVYAVAKAKSVWDNAATLNVEIDVHEASEGDFCSSAIDLTSETMPYTWTGNLLDYTDGFTGLASNGCTEITGPEVWFAVSVPGNQWLNVSNDTSTPVVMQLLSTCATNDCDGTGSNSVWWLNESSSAQTVYVAVEGNGVSVGALALEFSTTSTPPEVELGSGTYDASLPMDMWWNYSYSQTIFLAGDLYAGNIQQISWQFNGMYTSTETFVVYMGHTSKTNFTSSSDWISATGLTQVYSGSMTFSTAGWYDIDLDTPFAYNGSDNLVIAVDRNTGSYLSSAHYFYCTSAGTTRSIEYHQDGSDIDPFSPPTYATNWSYFPNTKIHY